MTLGLVPGCSSGPAPEPTHEPHVQRVAMSRPSFAIDKARILDLSYSLGERTRSFPTAEHAGTHLDAPSLLSEKGHAADEVPASRLAGAAWVLDARVACAKDRDHLVSKDDLAAMEGVSGTLPERVVVLVLTGWGRYWPSRISYLCDGHTPGLDPALARELLARKVRAVGIDAPSIDRGAAKEPEAHRLLAAANVPALLNVANLDALPATGAWVVAAPAKSDGGKVAPLGLVAFAPEREAPLSIDAGKGAARRVAQQLALVAPGETAIEVVDDAHLTAQIAPMFLGDARREVDLEARLERAAFLVRFLLREGPGSWNAPVWPLPKGHELEHGTPDERIARYEEPGRDAWQKPDDVVKALALAPDAVSVDVGSGSGYFARRLARAAPKGKTIGLDIEPRFVALVNEVAKRDSLPLEARLVLSDDPGLTPASVDLVLIVDTYHHLPERKAYLAKLRTALRPGGRIVVIDFKKGSKLGPPDDHKLAKETVVEEAKAVGLALTKEHDILPEQFFIELTAR